MLWQLLEIALQCYAGIMQFDWLILVIWFSIANQSALFKHIEATLCWNLFVTWVPRPAQDAIFQAEIYPETFAQNCFWNRLQIWTFFNVILWPYMASCHRSPGLQNISLVSWSKWSFLLLFGNNNNPRKCKNGKRTLLTFWQPCLSYLNSNLARTHAC